MSYDGSRWQWRLERVPQGEGYACHDTHRFVHRGRFARWMRRWL